MFRLVFISILLLAVASPAAARNQSISVSANKTSVLGEFYVYGRSNCHHSGKVDYSVRRQPKHGKVSVTFERRVIPSEIHKRCAGKRSSAMIIRYTPNRGYLGKDSSRIIFHYPSNQSGGRTKPETINISIDVK